MPQHLRLWRIHTRSARLCLQPGSSVAMTHGLTGQDLARPVPPAGTCSSIGVHAQRVETCILHDDSWLGRLNPPGATGPEGAAAAAAALLLLLLPAPRPAAALPFACCTFGPISCCACCPCCPCSCMCSCHRPPPAAVLGTAAWTP